MKPKHYIRQLKKEAKNLPVETYQALHKLSEVKYVDSSNTLHDSPAKEGEEPRRAIWRYVGEHLVNHGRRVKKLFKKHGQPAVDAYFFVKGGLLRQAVVDDYNRTSTTTQAI